MDAQRSVSAKHWTKEEVSRLIREIIVDLAPAPGDTVPDARLVEDLGYNSLSLLELAFSLEDEFELRAIDEETARKIRTVGDVERHVLAELASSGQLIVL